MCWLILSSEVGSNTNTKKERRGDETNMIILWYFNWRTPPGEDKWKGLKDYYEKVKKAFDQSGVKFVGPYAPLGDRWNFVWMFETESFDKYMEVFRSVGLPLPKEIDNNITRMIFPTTY